jgi:hypothetical protein
MEIKVDMKEIEALAEQLRVAQDQIHFATAMALNNSLFQVRSEIIDELWPSKVEVKNPHFMHAVLHVDKASKYKLSGSIREWKENTVQLILHAKGGTKAAQGKRFAIPLSWYRAGKQTQSGLRKNATAKAIIAHTPKRALRITEDAIYVGKGGRLQMIFKLQPQVKEKADVDFYGFFEERMRKLLFERLPGAMVRAMATRR